MNRIGDKTAVLYKRLDLNQLREDLNSAKASVFVAVTAI